MSDANLDDGANGRMSEAEKEALALSLWDAGLVRPEWLAREVIDHIDNDGIVREHTERAWDEGWTRGAKDMNETVRWGETNCERPTNPYAARQEQNQ